MHLGASAGRLKCGVGRSLAGTGADGQLGETRIGARLVRLSRTHPATVGPAPSEITAGVASAASLISEPVWKSGPRRGRCGNRTEPIFSPTLGVGRPRRESRASVRRHGRDGNNRLRRRCGGGVRSSCGRARFPQPGPGLSSATGVLLSVTGSGAGASMGGGRPAAFSTDDDYRGRGGLRGWRCASATLAPPSFSSRYSAGDRCPANWTSDAWNRR